MSTQTQRLTDTQIEYYTREGYLIHDQPVFPQASFDKLKTHFDAKLEMLDPSVRPEAMDVPHFTDTALFEWLFSDAVLDLVEPIIGPDIALWSSHFICKPKGDGKRVPWHEDSSYWRDRIDPMTVCTVWLAIDASTVENGCMYVVPRTHDNGYSDYEPVDPTKNVFSSEITPSQRRDQLAKPIELAPNYASLHDGKLIHGSPVNNSDKRRCGYTMRYMPTSVKMAPQEGAVWPHQIYLARGRDLAGNSYADPAKTYNNVMKMRVESGKKFH